MAPVLPDNCAFEESGLESDKPECAFEKLQNRSLEFIQNDPLRQLDACTLKFFQPYFVPFCNSDVQGARRKPSARTFHFPLSGKPGAGLSGPPSHPPAIMPTA
jgi:hypothetical protein